MSTRQDAWTKDEDLLLAEMVIRYIREGKTQMKAFEDVGKKLSRTPQACGFRWNANLRKQYQQAIELAKKDRKQFNDQFPLEQKVSDQTNNYKLKTFDEVIAQLEKLKVEYLPNQQSSVEQGSSNELEELRNRVRAYERCIEKIYEITKEVVEKEQ
nr:RsfA family transcriptional regulator [Alkalibacillus aidingensis]